MKAALNVNVLKCQFIYISFYMVYIFPFIIQAKKTGEKRWGRRFKGSVSEGDWIYIITRNSKCSISCGALTNTSRIKVQTIKWESGVESSCDRRTMKIILQSQKTRLCFLVHTGGLNQDLLVVKFDLNWF